MRNGRCAIALAAALAAGCASQAPAPAAVEGTKSLEAQRKAQAAAVGQAPAKPTLKYKVAVGRMSNESGYGRSLLGGGDDAVGRQAADMMAKDLAESGAYIVLERPDLGLLKGEADLAGKKLDLPGVDALVIGSVTELGRRTEGKTGFLSDSKKQVAFAKLDLRLVDCASGYLMAAYSGAGEASTETSSVAGFGSQASYDGTLSDAALRQAVSDAVGRMTADMLKRRWQTVVLKVEGDRVYIGGGKRQGVAPGMTFDVLTRGDRVKSQQTGFYVTLPGKPVARIRVSSTFGDTVLDEGSVASIVSGKIDPAAAPDLVVAAKE